MNERSERSVTAGLPGRLGRAAAMSLLAGTVGGAAVLAGEAFVARHRRYAEPELGLALRATIGRADAAPLRLGASERERPMACTAGGGSRTGPCELVSAGNRMVGGGRMRAAGRGARHLHREMVAGATAAFAARCDARTSPHPREPA